MTDSTASIWSLPVCMALVLGLCFRVVFVTATPFGGPSIPHRLSSYNDEAAHVRYAAHVMQHHRLPSAVESISENGAVERGLYEYYQPPLYYMLLASLGSFIGAETESELYPIGRWLAVALGVALIWICIGICRELNLAPQPTAAAIMFVALGGAFVRFTSMVGNEAMFWMLSGGLIWSLLHMTRWGASLRSVAVFVLLAVAALYTKLTALLLLPLLLVLLWRTDGRRAISGSMLLGGGLVIFLATIPLWMRNLSVFGGLIPISAGFGPPGLRIPNWSSAAYALRSFVFPWSEFWYGFAGLLLMLPLSAAFAVAIIRTLSLKDVRLHPVLTAALAISIVAFIALNVRYDQAEGRYLLLAWPAWCVLLGALPESPYLPWFLFSALLLPYLLFALPFLGI